MLRTILLLAAGLIGLGAAGTALADDDHRWRGERHGYHQHHGRHHGHYKRHRYGHHHRHRAAPILRPHRYARGHRHGRYCGHYGYDPYHRTAYPYYGGAHGRIVVHIPLY